MEKHSGTEAAEEEAFNYYSGVILRNARKQMHLTQGELAKIHLSSASTAPFKKKGNRLNC